MFVFIFLSNMLAVFNKVPFSEKLEQQDLLLFFKQTMNQKYAKKCLYYVTIYKEYSFAHSLTI